MGGIGFITSIVAEVTYDVENKIKRFFFTRRR